MVTRALIMTETSVLGIALMACASITVLSLIRLDWLSAIGLVPMALTLALVRGIGVDVDVRARAPVHMALYLVAGQMISRRIVG